MKKVGIVSCYFKNNYGSMLQAYATQKVIDNLGLENETFNIKDNVDFSKGKKKYYKSQIFNYTFIKSKLGMAWLKVYKKINKNLGKNIAIRDRMYEEFRKEFNLTKPYHTYKELTEATKKYSTILIGSDQLWLPVNVVADYYTLNWVPEDKNKVSYSTSFGVSQIPDKYKKNYKKFLNRINYISVREDSGCKIVKELTDKEATLVCDPTMLLTKEEWDELQNKEPIIKEKYILCYYLGKNIEHRKFAERLREKTGYKIVSLNHADEYVKYSDKFADIIPYDIGPKEFINLIKNAEYVCTDSFHGTVFSLIYNTKFFTFERYRNKNSKVSTNSRIYSLLGIMNLQNRILSGTENIDGVSERSIDFDIVNKKLSEFRKNSKKFLIESLNKDIEDTKNNENKYIEIEDKVDCCGCTACKSVCPKSAIEMIEDEEGFLYPKIDKYKCINCGLCKSVCPIINKKKEKINQERKSYIVNNKTEEVRKNSTSGGFFTPIAEYIINNGGVVFGASFDNNLNVCHTYTTNKDELYKFRGSKYVQSDLKNAFEKVKQFLDEDKYVLFSGTPCQIEGLKSYLRKDYEKLITVDVVCRAVPSPLVYRKYLDYQREKLNIKNIDKVVFRDKSKYGYKYSVLTIEGENKIYQRGVESDPYLRAFFKNISDRPSCFNCRFKKINRVSDITIWDCFITERFSKRLDDDKGTTRILLHSEKARKLFENIKKDFEFEEVNPDIVVKDVKEMYRSTIESKKRKEFFEDMQELNEEKLFDKYFPDSINVKIERSIRVALTKTGLYKNIKKVAKKILRKG